MDWVESNQKIKLLPALMLLPLVVVDELRKLDSCKVKVVLKAADLTKLTIVKNGVVSRGEGWDFLMGFLVGSSNAAGPK